MASGKGDRVVLDDDCFAFSSEVTKPRSDLGERIEGVWGAIQGSRQRIDRSTFFRFACTGQNDLPHTLCGGCISGLGCNLEFTTTR
ncbi:hypothetical protein D3C81_2158470 [compost metagenome]